MKNVSGIVTEDDDQLSLPPGFRFHPTDEELISDYLSNKVHDSRFCAIAIGEADLNNTEPWDLPSKAKMGEREWYFFVLRDKKYPTGLRTNRATESGYWKATGKDKEIYRGRSLVGMKKTLVFYTGRAPKGEKTDWVIHEFRLEGTLSIHNLPQSAKIEWVICRIFKKTSGGKKIHISNIIKPNTLDNDLALSDLPPLTNSDDIGNTSTVPCFSNPISVQGHLTGDLDDPLFTVYSNHIETNHLKIEPPNSYYSGDQYVQNPLANSRYRDSFLENYEPFMMHGFKQERDMVSDVTQDTGLTSDMNNEISSNFDMAYLLNDDYNFY